MFLTQIKNELRRLGNAEKAAHCGRFFKTAKGEYGEGDKFIGVTVPNQRMVARKFVKKLTTAEAFELLQSEIHEHRLTALFILVDHYKKASEKARKEIYELYLRNWKHVNNWDLVDSSAHKIVGEYLLNNPDEREILYKLAYSKNLWEKRIAMISTFTLIRAKQFSEALKLAEILLKDKHDLMHKAVGWMLREIGNRDYAVEKVFLDKHYKQMPRTMLRYAIEKLPPGGKAFYMKK
ncbi:MAG: DNA alkylation repair protein [Patescibacteria group bacterium]